MRGRRRGRIEGEGKRGEVGKRDQGGRGREERGKVKEKGGKERERERGGEGWWRDQSNLPVFPR